MLKSVELIGDDIIEVCIDDNKYELKLNKLEMMELSNRLDKLSRNAPNQNMTDLYDEIVVYVIDNYTNIIKRYIYKVGRSKYNKYMLHKTIKESELGKHMKFSFIRNNKDIVIEKGLCIIKVDSDPEVYRYNTEEYVDEVLTPANITRILDRYINSVNEKYDEYRLFVFDRSDLKKPFTITEIIIDSPDSKLLNELGRFNFRKDATYLSVTKRRTLLQAGKDNIELFKQNNYITPNETIDCRGMNQDQIISVIENLMVSIQEKTHEDK